MNLGAIISQVPVDPSFSSWWDITEKIGTGGCFVLGIVVFFLWRAYQDKDRQLGAEVTYSKERDKQTLAVMIELTTLIKAMDERDRTSSAASLSAINELKAMVREHFITHRNANAA